MPVAVNPPNPGDSGEWEFAWPANNWVKLTAPAGTTAPVKMSVKLVPTGTPDADVLSNVKYRIS